MKNIVVITGAGLGFESKLPTFKGVGNAKEQYDILNIATQEVWEDNPKKVLDHFNELRLLMRQAQPNNGHRTIAALDGDYRVAVVTTNVDDLQERAGSRLVIHLNGEINQVRSTEDPENVYFLENDDLLLGDECELGSQLRPHVVFKDEEYPNLDALTKIFSKADILIVVRVETSEEPIKTLIDLTPEHCENFIIAPKMPIWLSDKPFDFIEGKALDGLPALITRLLDDAMEEMEDEEYGATDIWGDDDEEDGGGDDDEMIEGGDEDIWGSAQEDGMDDSW